MTREILLGFIRFDILQSGYNYDAFVKIIISKVLVGKALLMDEKKDDRSCDVPVQWQSLNQSSSGTSEHIKDRGEPADAIMVRQD